MKIYKASLFNQKIHKYQMNLKKIITLLKKKDGAENIITSQTKHQLKDRMKELEKLQSIRIHFNNQ